MLSVQDALDLASSSSYGTMDIITCGFTPWGPESCPSLDQVMASSRPATAASTAVVQEAEAARDGADAHPDPDPDPEEEQERLRRQRRKMSNRLSAQRSRARKQQRLEELRESAARLRAEKQELEARLQALARHDLAVRCQNARLRAEATALARRVREASRLLALRRLAYAYALPQQQAAGVGVVPAAAAPLMGLASLMT
ncbi:hypothetical protein BDA96_01G078900 [Sorghum bicolor]|jgi:exonuclease VII large subunit|uniref:BZIP domain-containing protein n=2 Tax=Sorghum bicolor TaxID=4558 RepID=A0A921UWW0_SORBI|nr:DNA-binding protein EMBP-1 [Sorghum bicolor]EER93384.1 hypothetical protein SORBI_3001G075900 [Sorghum bicolor]KAG0547422.1 hypothetical protein BDA96_01G078900 [Sorghum bicolor]|eukprot:XP_002466386.1 DNA-binding protein EMBP-1 [Sorghum bicolor]